MISAGNHFVAIRFRCPPTTRHSESQNQCQYHHQRPVFTNSYSTKDRAIDIVKEEKNEVKLQSGGNGIVVVDPKPKQGLAAKAIDFVESLIVKLMFDSSKPLHFLSGNFHPVHDETPPTTNLPVGGHLPECLNGEFVRIGPNPKFAPVAGYHWFDGDGLLHGLRIKNGKATYVSRFVRTSRLKQEEFLGGAKFAKFGDLKGLFGLLMFYTKMLRVKFNVLDLSFGFGTGNTALIYHHGKLLALMETDKPYVLKVLEDGDLQTLGMLDYDKRLKHPFTAHPKIDPYTGEMFTFGYSQTPPYITYRVVSKDGFMYDPVPITISNPIMMHDFAITEKYAIFMDLPMCFREEEMVKENKLIYSFDPTIKARFGILPRYAKDEHQIRWFELPNCYIFHNANAWEEGEEVVLISCRVKNPDLDMLNGPLKEETETLITELYEMRFNMNTGLASQKKLSAPTVDFPRINERYCGRFASYIDVSNSKEPSMGTNKSLGYVNWQLIDLNSWTQDDVQFCVSSDAKPPSLAALLIKQRYVYGTILDSFVKITGIIKFDLHSEPEAGKTKLEVGGNVKGIFDLGPGKFGSEAVFVPREHSIDSQEDDGYLIFFVHDENSGKSAVYVIDAATMSPDPVAVVELPHRIPYGFHGLFVTEEQLQEVAKL